jgi:hypothetical protein
VRPARSRATDPVKGAGTAALSRIAIVVALASLAINLFLVLRLRQVEARAAQAVARFQTIAGDDTRLRFPVRIPAGSPIRFDAPIDERVVISIDTVLPIRTRAVLPLRSPLGNYDIRVPVVADVPLRLRTPLHIRHTVRIDARTSGEIVIPLELRLADLPVDSLLRLLSTP